jgi:hypothetical protein
MGISGSQQLPQTPADTFMFFIRSMVRFRDA